MVSRWTSVCLSVCLSIVHPSVRFSFPDDNLSKHQWIFTKSGVCIDIMGIWYELLKGEFHQILTELSAQFFFVILGQNLSKHHENMPI